MNDIHIVSIGEYSDNSDVAAFTDKPKADAFAKSIGGYVCSVPLDPEDAVDVEGKTTFRVESHNQDLAILTVESVEPEYNIADAVSREAHRYYRMGKPYLSTIVFAKDELHATKIAADRFRQYVAERGWK